MITSTLLNRFKNYFPAQQDFRLKIYSKQFLIEIAIQVGFSPEDFMLASYT